MFVRIFYFLLRGSSVLQVEKGVSFNMLLTNYETDTSQTDVCIGTILSWYSVAQTKKKKNSFKQSVYFCRVPWNVMDELRVQVNHLYDPPYSPHIRRMKDLMNGLYPNWQHIYPLRKFQLPQLYCPKCRFLLHQGKPSGLQATKHLM
jgi:hypothetical protein